MPVDTTNYEGSPPRSSWKYAWSDASYSGMSTSSRRNAPPGAGKRASERLFTDARSGRQAREELKRSLRGEDRSNETRRIPQPNKMSAKLAADRYDRVMSHTVTGRYRKEALAIARAKGEESMLNRDVYNYGDMLFQEAEMTRQKRDEWRSEQLREKDEAEVAEATFQPQTSRTGSAMSAVAYGGSDEPLSERELLERIERQASERAERQQALTEIVRREEERELTFKPTGSNEVSKKLTRGYGNVLEEMAQRDRERQMRLRDLVSRDEYVMRIANNAKSGAKPPKGLADSEGGGGKQRADPNHRLHVAHTSSYHQSLLPEATGDPECTFQPNVNTGAREGLNREGGGGKDAEGGVERAGKAGTTSRVSAAEVGDALYRDAHNRRLRQAMLEAQSEAEAHEKRNAPKMSERSSRFALRKVEREVSEIYEALNKPDGQVRDLPRSLFLIDHLLCPCLTFHDLPCPSTPLHALV